MKTAQPFKNKLKLSIFSICLHDTQHFLKDSDLVAYHQEQFAT